MCMCVGGWGGRHREWALPLQHPSRPKTGCTAMPAALGVHQLVNFPKKQGTGAVQQCHVILVTDILHVLELSTYCSRVAPGHNVTEGCTCTSACTF